MEIQRIHSRLLQQGSLSPCSQLSHLYLRLNPREYNWEVGLNSSDQSPLRELRSYLSPLGISLLWILKPWLPLAYLMRQWFYTNRGKPRGFPSPINLASRGWVSLTEKFVTVLISHSRPLVRAGVGEKKQVMKYIAQNPFQRHCLHLQQSLGNLKPK